MWDKTENEGKMCSCVLYCTSMTKTVLIISVFDEDSNKILYTCVLLYRKKKLSANNIYICHMVLIKLIKR